MVGQTVVPACPSVEQLHLHARGKLPEPEADTFDYHLGVCPACMSRFDGLQASLIGAMRQAHRDRRESVEPDSVESLIDRVGQLRGDMPAKSDTINDVLHSSSIVDRNKPTRDVEQTAKERQRERLFAMLRPAEQADEVGRLGGYRILSVLGVGGMGAVFKAEDPRLKRLIAKSIR